MTKNALFGKVGIKQETFKNIKTQQYQPIATQLAKKIVDGIRALGCGEVHGMDSLGGTKGD